MLCLATTWRRYNMEILCVVIVTSFYKSDWINVMNINILPGWFTGIYETGDVMTYHKRTGLRDIMSLIYYVEYLLVLRVTFYP